METYSSILAWRIPWTGEPGGLQSMGVSKVGNNLATKPLPPIEFLQFKFPQAFLSDR